VRSSKSAREPNAATTSHPGEQMEEEHDRMVDELEQDADHSQEPSRDLDQDIKDTRDDWDQKTKTESVPGAMELPDEEDEEPDVNEFELEERTPETAEAQGPSGVESDEDDDEEDDD
jgi:hypothetical protein